MRRFRRRYRGRRQQRALPLWAIVAIVAGAVLIAAVVTGNILNSCLDDDAYRRLTEGETGTKEPDKTPAARAVPAVRAYPFRLGASLRTLGSEPPEALILPLNDADGRMCYRSPVTSYLGLETVTDAASDAEKSMTSLAERVPYLIGVWQVRLPGDASDAVIGAAAATDAAILREFLSFGGTELLLEGLPLDEKHFATTYAYLSALRDALGEGAVLSAAVPLSVAEGEFGHDVLYTLMQKLSLLTLDLTAEADIGLPEAETDPSADPSETDASTAEPSPDSPLLRARFFLSAYQMRLLLSASQPSLLRSAEASLADYAVRAAGGGS